MRKYYLLDEHGVIFHEEQSEDGLAEMQALFPLHDVTANPTQEQLALWDRRT